jgi:hypothetical protein
VQERIESSVLGRALIGAFIAVTLLWVAATNLPESALKRDLLRQGGTYLNAVGLDQDWSLFAPEPRRRSLDLTARVTYDDGSSTTWTFPHDGPIVGQYRDYRWRKWLEYLIAFDATQLWPAAAQWSATERNRPQHRVSAVALVENVYDLFPPGTGHGDRGPTQRAVFYIRQWPRLTPRARAPATSARAGRGGQR